MTSSRSGSGSGIGRSSTRRSPTPCSVLTGTSNGRDGWATRAPFDRLVAWCSVADVPRAWRDQTRPGAVLVVPTRRDGASWIAKYRRTDRDDLAEIKRLPGGFIPLTPTPFKPWEAAEP